MTGQGSAIPAKASKSFDFVGCIRHRAVIIVILGAVLASMVAPIAFFKGQAYYETDGKILLAREMPQITGRGDEFNIANYFHDYARTQVERIRSLQTIEAALAALPESVRRLYVPKPGSEKLAAAGLEKHLTVMQIPNTHVIQVKLTAPKAAGMAEVVNAVMAAYLERLHGEEENKEQRRIEFLTQERDGLLASIASQTKEVQEIVRSTKTSPDQDQNDIYVRRVVSLQDAFVRAQAERMGAESNWNQTRDMAEKLRKVSGKALVDEMVVGDQSLWRTASWTYEKMQELRASIDGVTKENPDRQYVEKRMEAMQQYEEKQRQDVQERAERIVNEKRDYDLSQRLIAAEKEFEVRRQTEDDLRQKLDDSLGNLERNSQDMLRGKALLANIENDKKKYFELESRIRDLIVNAKAPLRVAVESYAVEPETPAGNNRSKLLLLSVISCFGLVGAAVFLYDFTDDRIRSPKNVADYLGRPPTWPISDYRPAAGDGYERFPRVLAEDPGCNVAKSLRSLAVRLNKERLEHDARVAVLSAVNPGGGATAIALNAAQAMLHFCPRVLLVEADNLRPGLGRLLGARTGDIPDLPAVLSGAAPIETCVRRDELRDLDCLLLGEGRWNEALYRELPVFLARLRETYDFIFINAAPVLETDLTEMLLVQADVAVLVVQGDRTTYADFTRSAEIILRLEAPALASVLNWGGPKPVTRFDRFLSNLPWPVLRRWAIWLSNASKSSAFLALALVSGLSLAAAVPWASVPRPEPALSTAEAGRTKPSATAAVRPIPDSLPFVPAHAAAVVPTGFEETLPAAARLLPVPAAPSRAEEEQNGGAQTTQADAIARDAVAPAPARLFNRLVPVADGPPPRLQLSQNGAIQ